MMTNTAAKKRTAKIIHEWHKAGGLRAVIVALKLCNFPEQGIRDYLAFDRRQQYNKREAVMEFAAKWEGGTLPFAWHQWSFLRHVRRS